MCLVSGHQLLRRDMVRSVCLRTWCTNMSKICDRGELGRESGVTNYTRRRYSTYFNWSHEYWNDNGELY